MVYDYYDYAGNIILEGNQVNIYDYFIKLFKNIQEHDLGNQIDYYVTNFVGNFRHFDHTNVKVKIDD